MTPLRAGLLSLLLLALVSWAIAKRLTSTITIPTPVAKVNIVDLYDTPLLSRYKLFQDAITIHDIQSLQTLSQGSDYLAFQAALELAQDLALSQEERYQAILRADAIRIDDPLDRQGRRAFKLELAKLAESAARFSEALDAYEQALPLEEAIEGIKRIEFDPYKRANRFLNNRLYQEVLDALAGRLAPSLEAPAYRRLGDYEGALDAYDRWLVEVPGSAEALLGSAWSLFALGRNQEAEAIFAQNNSAEALYGRALALKRLGDIDTAIQLLQETNDVDDLWLAAGYLEEEERYVDAIPLYLRLARGSSKLADDSAYRAYLLAGRVGDDRKQEESRALIPEDSFFALKVGQVFQMPAFQEVPLPELAVTRLADALSYVGEYDAARGELSVALRNSNDSLVKLAIAQKLYDLGEFRQAQRAASLLLAELPGNELVWRLAYPQAFASYVLEESQTYALEPALVWAIMRQESAFFPGAVSRSNAKGLMQVIPSTWNWLAELQKESPADPFDPATNIRYGVFYLDWMREYYADYQGDQELMIVSYNRGQGYIRRLYETDYVNQNKDELYREIDALESREYLQSVTMNYHVYKSLYP